MADLQMVVTARLNALEFLTTHHPEDYTCCGQPLEPSTGRCSYRPHHATPAYENITGYPEKYDIDGRYIGPITKAEDDD